MAQKFLAPSSVRQDPEIFCWFHHANVSLGLVVVEGDPEVDGESQYVGSLSIETHEEIEGLLLVARPLPSFGCRVGGEALGHQASVADADGVQHCGIEMVSTSCRGRFDVALCLDEERGQVIGPPLIPPDADGIELSQVVGDMQNSPYRPI